MSGEVGTCRHATQAQWVEVTPADGGPRRREDWPAHYFCQWPIGKPLPPPLQRLRPVAEIRAADCAACPFHETAIDLAAIIKCAK